MSDEKKNYTVRAGEPLTFDVQVAGVEYTAPHHPKAKKGTPDEGDTQWFLCPIGWLTVHEGHRVRATTPEAEALLQEVFSSQ